MRIFLFFSLIFSSGDSIVIDAGSNGYDAYVYDCSTSSDSCKQINKTSTDISIPSLYFDQAIVSDLKTHIDTLMEENDISDLQTPIYVCGTSAFRVLSERQLNRIRELILNEFTGYNISVNVISLGQEAVYSYISVNSVLNREPGNTVMVISLSSGGHFLVYEALNSNKKYKKEITYKGQKVTLKVMKFSEFSRAESWENHTVNVVGEAKSLKVETPCVASGYSVNFPSEIDNIISLTGASGSTSCYDHIKETNCKYVSPYNKPKAFYNSHMFPSDFSDAIDQREIYGIDLFTSVYISVSKGTLDQNEQINSSITKDKLGEFCGYSMTEINANYCNSNDCTGTDAYLYTDCFDLSLMRLILEGYLIEDKNITLLYSSGDTEVGWYHGVSMANVDDVFLEAEKSYVLTIFIFVLVFVVIVLVISFIVYKINKRRYKKVIESNDTQ